jgi:hypothetical protein
MRLEGLGATAGQTTRGARRWSWTFLKVKFIFFYLIKKEQPHQLFLTYFIWTGAFSCGNLFRSTQALP